MKKQQVEGSALPIASIDNLASCENSTRVDSTSEVPKPLQQLKLSDFVVLEELGSGGFGQVDLVRFADEGQARACKMPTRVALKRVFMGKHVNNNMKLQTMKEALFLKELPSTHFIKLYHSFFE